MRYENLSDAELIALLCKGTRAEKGQAFGELEKRYTQRLILLVCRLVGNPDTAEEIVRETLVRMLAHACRFDPNRVNSKGLRTTVRAWLTRIASNLAIDYLRREHPQQWAAGPEVDETGRSLEEIILNEGPGPVQQAEDRERWRILDACLEELRERHLAWHTVCILLYYDEFKIWEIAEMMGVPEGTVQGQSWRARNFLRERLLAKGVTM